MLCFSLFTRIQMDKHCASVEVQVLAFECYGFFGWGGLQAECEHTLYVERSQESHEP